MTLRADLPPGPDDRQALLAMLADVMEELGWQHFVRAPIVLPTDAFFPDAAVRDLGAVGAIAGRVASYAGLEERVIEIVAPKTMSLEDLAMLEARGSAPDAVDDAPASTIFLAEVDHDVARLGVEVSALAQRSAPGIVAEVARAVVAAELVDAGVVEVEEVDSAGEVDVACIALGLGVIVTNAALRLRRHAEIVGRSVISRDEIDVVTARAPHELAFLLAAQVVVRGDHSEGIAAYLEPDQRAAFIASTKLLDRDALLRALQIPPASEWPTEIARGEADVRVTTPDDDSAPAPRGQVIRVRINRRPEGAGIGLMLGMLVFLVMVLRDVDLGLTGLGLWGAMTVVGALVGARRRADECSRRECQARLPIEATTCAGCGGTIEGECLPGKVLEAEEALEARAKSSGYREPAR